MFRSQGQGSTAIRRQRSSRTGRALVLETKHEADYTQYSLRGQTAAGSETSRHCCTNTSLMPSSARTFAAPATRAASLARATSRARAPSRNWCRAAIDPAGTYLSAERRTSRRPPPAFRRGPSRRRWRRPARPFPRAADQFDRHMRVHALQRHLVRASRTGEQRKRLLVLAPFAAQRLFPVVVGLDAVAVADVHRRRARQALGRALERAHAPVAHFVEEDVERRLVELDHVDAGRRDFARFRIQDFGKRPGELLAAAVVHVVERIDHGHRPGQRQLDRAAVVRLRRKRASSTKTGRAARTPDPRPPERRRRSDCGCGPVFRCSKSTPSRCSMKVVTKWRRRLLAVGHDVDARAFLVARARGARRRACLPPAHRPRSATAPTAWAVASQAGLGRLPASVVWNSMGGSRSRRGCGSRRAEVQLYGDPGELLHRVTVVGRVPVWVPAATRRSPRTARRCPRSCSPTRVSRHRDRARPVRHATASSWTSPNAGPRTT